MHRILLSAFFAASPLIAQSTQQPADRTEAILAQERLFWTNYTTGNTVGLSQQLLPEFTNVEQSIWNREQVLNFVRVFTSKCSLAPVTILDPQVRFIAPDAATIVYHATETPTWRVAHPNASSADAVRAPSVCSFIADGWVCTMIEVPHVHPRSADEGGQGTNPSVTPATARSSPEPASGQSSQVLL